MIHDCAKVYCRDPPAGRFAIPSDVPASRANLALAALCVTQIVSWGGIYYAISVLMVPMQADLGWSRDALVAGYSVALLAWGLSAYPVGRLIDAFGGRGVMTAGSVLGTVALAMLGDVQTHAAYYAAWVLAGVAMGMTLYEAAFTVLAHAFGAGARRAITALTLAGGFASTLFWPLSQFLLEAWGWRGAWFALAAAQAVVCVPLHAFALPRVKRPARRPADDAAPPRDRAWLRSWRFWMLAVAFVCSMFATASVSVHLIALLGERGLSAREAVFVAALIGPMQFVGRFMEFAFGRRVGTTTLGRITVLLMPAGLLVYALAGTSIPLLVAFAVVYGTGFGLITIVRAMTPAELFGREEYGALNGAMSAPAMAARAAGPLALSVAVSAWGGGAATAVLLATISGCAVAYWVAVAGK